MKKLVIFVSSVFVSLLLMSSLVLAVSMSANAHVENIGWTASPVSDRIKIGTEGQGLRIEAFTLVTDDPDLQDSLPGTCGKYRLAGACDSGADCGNHRTGAENRKFSLIPCGEEQRQL